MPYRSRTSMTTLILGSYALILVAVVGLGLFVISTMAQLQRITEDLYIHPFAVSNAAAEMKGTLYQLRNHMLGIAALKPQDQDLQRLRTEDARGDAAVRENLKVIKAYFLGDKQQVAELEGLLSQWTRIRQQILDQAAQGHRAQATQIMQDEGTPLFHTIVPHVDYVLSFARDRAKRFVDEGESRSRQKVNQTRWLIALLAVFIIVTGTVVLKLVWLLQTLLTLQATRDALTGIPNRRNFMDIASREIHRAQRYGHPLSLAVVDLDLFKRINDAHGHHTGDLVLQAFCQTCRNTLRDSDVIGRVGGEEFAILLPNTSQAEAQEVIERVRKAVEATRVPTAGPTPLCFTASFGISTLHQGSTPADLGNLLSRADGALYQAKERGRNQVFLSPA